jgi:hypothetical protein
VRTCSGCSPDGHRGKGIDAATLQAYFRNQLSVRARSTLPSYSGQVLTRPRPAAFETVEFDVALFEGSVEAGPEHVSSIILPSVAVKLLFTDWRV